MSPYSMGDMKNAIEIDWSDNPDLADVFHGKDPGDPFEIKVKGTIGEMDEAGMTGSIDAVVVAQGKKEETVETNPDEPVMMVMRGKASEDEDGDIGTGMGMEE